ncbi:MAG: NADH-quinone oxidoreductase subunit C [Betaproteobacteria bacterium]
MRKELEAKLKADLQDGIVCVEKTDERTISVEMKRESVKKAANIVKEAGGRYLCSIGYDNIERDQTLGLVHAFAFDKENRFVNLRTSAPVSDPVVESITPIIPSAGWSEREYMDLLGFKFANHPKPKKLIVADDWPADIFPMRKEVPHDLVPQGAEDVAYQLDEAPPGTKIVPVGPFHPCLHEPEHFAVYVDGETIKGCDYRGFMTHRGIEKLCQTQVSYNEIPFIAERICGICGSVHATAYSQCVESAAGIQIPRRAEYIRTVMLEIERIHSNLLWLGVAGHLIGFDTVFMQAWRVREQIMWLCERMTGNRKTYGMVLVGGVRRDITPEVANDIRAVIKKIEEELIVIHRAVEKDTSIHKRTKGVGCITKQEAIDWSLVGPVARARGVDIDARRDMPYAAYDEMQFEVPVLDSCDVWATLVVRVVETFEAIKIIRQALDKMPGGEYFIEFKDKVPALRHAISTVEAPRGESVHYLITGEENRPERWRVRAPTYPNLQGVPAMLLNDQFADFPIIVGSIDPCFSCTDRVAVIDVNSGKSSSLTKAELERLSRKN